MTGRTKWYRKRPFYGALLVAVVVLAVPVTQGLAGSGSSAQAPIERYNDDCGDTQGLKVMGKDTFNRSGNTMTIIHKVSSAYPGQYSLYLYDYTGCAYVGYLGDFKVDGSGSGSKTGSVDVTGWDRNFFVCDYNNTYGFYDCGLHAKV